MAALGLQTGHLGYGNSYRPLADAIDGGLPRFKMGVFTCPDTTDATNTVSIDVYERFGITKVLIVEIFTHTTTNSVVIQDASTTVVDGTTLTVTIAAGSDDDKRAIVVYGI
jgi:hypothetical protein